MTWLAPLIGSTKASSKRVSDQSVRWWSCARVHPYFVTADEHELSSAEVFSFSMDGRQDRSIGAISGSICKGCVCLYAVGVAVVENVIISVPCITHLTKMLMYFSFNLFCKISK